MNTFARLLALSLTLVITACDSGGGGSSDGDSGDNGGGGGADTTRNFYLGFTPWPYAASIDAVNTTYDIIQDNGDIIAHHLTVGIPWQEALQGSAYPNHLEAEIDGRLNRTRDNMRVYLAIDPLDVLRTELIGNWGENGTEPRSGAWALRSFSSPEVISAYTNFALDMIDRFDPDYFCYATEISELMLNAPNQFNLFVPFAQQVYDAIKARHPDLPIIVSLALKSPGSGASDIIARDFPRIADYVDMAGASVYPYAFFDAGDAETPADMPDNWLSQINRLAPGKPVTVTESGWTAENLSIPTLGLSAQSTPALQNDFVERLLLESQDLDAEFVIWFSAVDYDTFWNAELGRNDLAAIWRDIGLYDQNLNARRALDTWRGALDLRRSD
jgi:hypothetical protein